MPTATPVVDSALRAQIAPRGVALNLANFLLVARAPNSGAFSGIAPTLAHEIGRRLSLPVELSGFDTPGQVAEAVAHDAWDIAFLGAEPSRAQSIDFTAAYLEIDATYLVPAASTVQTLADVDRAGMRISVSNKSAYELFLSRTLKHATLVRVDGVEASFQTFVVDKLDVLAGLRPRLLTECERLPGSRILAGGFTAIQQAIGVPKGRDRAAGFVRAFVEDVKASGVVARLIAEHQALGATVAPAAP